MESLKANFTSETGERSSAASDEAPQGGSPLLTREGRERSRVNQAILRAFVPQSTNSFFMRKEEEHREEKIS